MTNNNIDILIIGSGPAGLAAATCCLNEGLDFVIVEQGSKVEKRNIANPKDITSGVGGAGLFSDGKLSYYPSGKGLWNLPAKKRLQTAYKWFHNLISDFDYEVPNFPEHFFDFDALHNKKIDKNFYSKEYFSYVMDESQRNKLLQRLLSPLSHKIQTNRKVSSIESSDYGYKVTIVSSDNTKQYEKIFETKQIIYCAGRHGSINLKKMLPNLDFIFRRFEYGIRIEQNSNNFFLNNWPTIDAKLVLTSDDKSVEWRTFCCCRKGSVLKGRTNESIVYSGSSTTNTESSNIGFNVRINDRELFQEVQTETQKLLSGEVPHFQENVEAFLKNDGKTNFGSQLDLKLKNGLQKLCDKYDLSNSMIYGPCIEGVGYYPWLSTNLETRYSNLYVAGDSTGLFRGLLSSLLSGYFAAKSAISKSLSNKDAVKSSVTIKKSSISTLPLIFTAQSKKFFYSRDVICEYVFKQKMLPINPFRIFDYFLSDRVPRDIIRQGNNHLVRACDELWIFGPIADGVLFEVIYAINMNKPVRFFSIGTRCSEIYPLKKLGDIVFEAEVHSTRQKRVDLLKEIELAFRNYQPKKQLDLPF